MKIEYYLSNLTQYNNEELENINNSKMYNKNARKAAKEIITNRKVFQNRISSLNNEDIKNLFLETKQIHCKYDFEVFLKEFAKRNIPIKIWFLKNNGKEDGPYTTNEIKSMVDKEIDYHDTYLRRKDMKEWFPSNWVKGLFKDDYIPKEKGNYLKIAAILIFISCGLWFLVAYLQFTIGGAGARAIFNFIGSAIWLGIGRGVLQKKEWAHRSGIAWATVTALYNFIIAIADSFNPFIMFLVFVEVSIIFSLKRGRKSVIAEKRVDLGFKELL